MTSALLEPAISALRSSCRSESLPLTQGRRSGRGPLARLPSPVGGAPADAFDHDGAPRSVATAFSAQLASELLRGARRRCLARGEVLYHQGSIPDAIYLVESGAVQLSTTSPNGREAVLGVVESGMWFGELSLYIRESRVHDARALTDTALRVIPEAHLHRTVDDSPAFLRELLELVCRRYKWAIERIDASILRPVPVRLADRLLADASGSRAGERGVSRQIRLSQERLGQMLGVSRQTVNKQLKQWESEGLVTLTYGRIDVVDREALLEIARS